MGVLAGDFSIISIDINFQKQLIKTTLIQSYLYKYKYWIFQQGANQRYLKGLICLNLKFWKIQYLEWEVTFTMLD